MDDQQEEDYREQLVAAGVINKMTHGSTPLGYEWAKQAPDGIDEQVFAHLDRLKQSIPPRILDLGCAHGSRLARYAQAGFECIGVDITDRSQSIADANTALSTQGKPSIQFIQADIRKLEPADFAKDEFAVITCSQVIHFMDRDDIINLMRFIKKIASPTTLICVSFDTVQNTSDMWRLQAKILCDERMRFMDMIGYKPSEPLQHRYYHEADISTIIEAVGLKLHNTLRAQRGVTAFTASMGQHPIFEMRPSQSVGLKAYFYLAR